MKTGWCFASVWALAAVGVMLLAGPALAQNQSGGPAGKPAGHGELCTGGPGGTCAVTPPPKQGKQNGPASQQKGCSQAPRGAGSGNQPKTQANPAATSR
ncbi:MAG: hypothetical protein ACLPYB_13265 [Desulfobaccales bacterium]